MALEAGDVVVPGRRLAARLAAVGGRARADAARAAAARLCEPDILTAHGLRTLAATDPNFGADRTTTAARSGRSTRGSAGAGLRACGRAREAERVRTGVLAALDELGRAPELYAVEPLAPIALSNRVQAWTVGARWALEHSWDGRV